LINLNLSQDLVLGGKNGESACVRGNFVGYEVNSILLMGELWGASFVHS